MIRSSSTVRVFAALAGLACSAAASAAVVEVIHTGIPGHPTAQVPGQAPGVQFRGPLASFQALFGSPSGNFWILKAFTNEADTINEVMIVGDNSMTSTVAKEGSASPLAGLNYGFMDSDCAINDSGDFAFGNRLSAGTTTDEIIFKRDTMGMIVPVAREGSPALGLFDTGTIGDELFGNSLNSPVILNNNTVLFRADLIQNIATAFRSAIYSGSTVLAQEGTTLTGGTYDSFVASSLAADANGTNWIVEADIDPAAVGTTEAAILNGSIVLKDGDSILGITTVSDIFATDLSGNGDWYVRGQTASNLDFVVRNGIVIAETNGPIYSSPPGAPTWGDSIGTVTSNAVGDYVIAGNFNSGDPNSDQVMVYNSSIIVAQEGDTADLNNNGADDDDAFITSFNAGDVVLSNSGVVTFVATIRNGAGTNLGSAILRRELFPPSCPGDFDGDNMVGLSDIAVIVGNWGMPGFGLEQIAEVITNWGNTCT